MKKQVLQRQIKIVKKQELLKVIKIEFSRVCTWLNLRDIEMRFILGVTTEHQTS